MTTRAITIQFIIWSILLVWVGGACMTVSSYTEVDQQFWFSLSLLFSSLGVGFLGIVYSALLRGDLTHRSQSVTKESHG